MSQVHTLLLLHAGLVCYAASTILGILAVRRDHRHLLTGARGALIFAVLLHGVLLFWIGIDEKRFPVATLAEAILVMATLMSGAALFLDKLRSMPIFTVGVAPLATAAVLFAAGLALRSSGRPSALEKSAWTGVHVLITLAAFGYFALAFVASVLFLIERKQLKDRSRPPVLGLMPSLERLYGLILNCLAIGLFLLTLGIVIGYLHARTSIRVTGWRLDPKIIMTTVTWLAYSIVMFLSFVPAFRGRRTAIGAAACFVLVAATIWVSVFWSGFHRFA